MDTNIEIALKYEDEVDGLIMDYYTSRDYTITRREDLDRIDYDVTHGDKDILLEVKTRDAKSTDYPTAWIREDKVQAMERYSLTYHKPCWLMYVYKGDNKFFLTNVEQLKQYGTVTTTVYNPIKQQVTEVNVEIPLSEQKFHALKTNNSKTSKTNDGWNQNEKP